LFTQVDVMNITANNQVTNLRPQNLESVIPNANDILLTLGAELVYIQDSSGRYLVFSWQHSEFFDLDTEKIVDQVSQDRGKFTPVDKVAYLEKLHQVLTSLVPQRLQCKFQCSQHLLELELTMTPLMPQLGEAATTVLVMGRLLSAAVNQTELYGEVTIPTLLELTWRSQQHQKLLNQLTRDIRRTLDPKIIWQQTADSLGKALNIAHCIICPYQPQKPTLKVIAEYHHPGIKSVLGLEIELSSEPAMIQALTTLEPLLIETPSYINDQHYKMLVVATYYRKQANGLIVLNLNHKCLPLTKAELELAKEVGDQLGTAFAHANIYQELETARQKAEEASRLKSQFLANVSHEIRTPLNGMIGFIKLILDGMVDEPEEMNSCLEEAYQSSLHLLNILNDILDTAKIEAGKMELNCVPVQLKDLFTQVENFMRPQAEMKNLSFQINIPATSDPIIIQADYQRLLQVMLNLVGNAIKFTNEGGITISADLVIRRGRTRLPLQQIPGMLRVRVMDTGIGVSLDKQDKLFQLFSQVDGSRTRHYGGTGLGLTISQKLVESMGGEVHFFSLGEGLGSTVTFTVPLYQKPVIHSVQED